MTWLEFQVTLAIKLSLQIYTEPSYVAWANKWLDGSDRTISAAYTAASDAASDAAYTAASSAAAYSAAAYDYAAAYAYAASYAYAAYAASDATNSISSSIQAGAKLESVIKFL